MFSALHKLRRRLQYWVRRDRHERELREEIEEHRRMRGAASVASPALSAEEARAVWIPASIASFVQDLRYGARQLGHNKLFTFVSLTGLALAIGLNTAFFSVVEAVYWRPLPVKDAERVVRLLRVGRDDGGDRAGRSFSEAELRHYRESGVLEALTGVAMDDRLIVDWPQATAPRGTAAFLTPDFFETLGVELVAGRMPLEDDGAILITESAWRRRLLSRADVIGAPLTLNGFPFRIAGVVADKSIAITGAAADMVLPLRAAAFLRLPEVTSRLRLIGKLRRDTGIEQVQAALGLVAQRWRVLHPEDTYIYRPIVLPARLSGASGLQNSDGPEVLLLVAVFLVLVIACANLTNLLLARADARRREMAMRLSLGASRTRLIRQLLTECFLLTTLAGLLGMALANAVLRMAQAAMPLYLPPEAAMPWFDLGINGSVFLYAFSLCAATACLFGLAPALEATRTDVASTMKGDAPVSSKSGGSAGAKLRGFLIAMQMAACMVLLILASNLSGAMSVLDDFLTSLDSAAVVQADMRPRGYGYSSAAAQSLMERSRERIAGLAGVEAVAITRFPMMRVLGRGAGAEIEIEGRAGRAPAPGMSGIVSDGCVRVFGFQLSSGRDFSPAESRTAAPVVLISSVMARELWPGTIAIGQRIRVWSKGQPEPWQEVIGVVTEKALTLKGAGGQTMFRPYGPPVEGVLQIRTRGDRNAIMIAVRNLIRDLDPRMAVNVNSLEGIVNFVRWSPRLVSAASFLISLASLWMSAIGLYGVTAYLASRRTKEIGIRMALGAQPSDVLRMMARQGGWLVLAGLAFGSALATVAERMLTASLRLLPASPVSTYLAIASFLAAVGLVAILAPSVKATRANPRAALRNDG